MDGGDSLPREIDIGGITRDPDLAAAETLGDRVFEVEKEAYPHVLRLLAAGRITLEGRRVRIAASTRRSESSPDE